MDESKGKTLFLIRHAKSSWDHAGLADHDRPLNKRGQHDAPMMGQRLLTRNTAPDQIYSSTALRALSTARAMASELGLDPDAIITDQDLYLASASELLHRVQHFDDAADCCFLVSHNPGITSFANRLANLDIDNVPTCGIVELNMNIQHWPEAQWGRARLLDFDYPKKIRP